MASQAYLLCLSISYILLGELPIVWAQPSECIHWLICILMCMYIRLFCYHEHACLLFVHAVYLSVGDLNITANNTAIPLLAIGEDAGRPRITCHTDLTACCRNSDTGGQGGLGEWYYPDGRVVPNQAAYENYYRVRNAPQVVRLARRVFFEPLGPTGLFCCEMPTTQGKMRICINLGMLIEDAILKVLPVYCMIMSYPKM